MKLKGLTLRIIFLLILTDIVESISMFCFKKMSMATPTPAEYNIGDIVTAFNNVVTSPFLWIFLVCMVLTFILWSSILSEIDLSVAFPLASLSFIFVPVGSIFIFHEHVGFWRWVGISFITIGIILLSDSASQGRAET